MEAMMTFVQPFFDWLLQTTLIGSVVICLILAAQKTLGSRLGPRWCHALWLVLIVRMVLPWSPSSRLSLFNLVPSWDRQVQRQQPSETTERQGIHEPVQTAAASDRTEAQVPESEATIPDETAREPRTLGNVPSESQRRLVSLRPVLPILWLAGAIVIGMYILVSDLALWRIVKRDRVLVNQEMLELFEECKEQMDVQSLVVVVPSSEVRSPGLFGFVRPRLLLPREILDAATAEEMRYVFLHELAHLKRRDIYLGWLTSLLQILHWFNPLIWFAFYRMRMDRELACDALVLTRTGQEKSHEYGGAIVGLLRRFSRPRRLPAMAGIVENRSQLKRRIAMIAQFKNNSYKWSPLGAALIIGLACIVLPDAPQTTKGGEALAEKSAIEKASRTDSNVAKSSTDSASKPKADTEIAGSQAVSGLTLRKMSNIPSGFDLPRARSISRDGRYLLGPAGILDLTTGEIRKVDNFDKSQFTPDGSRIVGSVGSPRLPPKDDSIRSVAIFDLRSGKTEEIYRSEDLSDVGRYMDCSSNGQNILAQFWKKNKSRELVSISIGDGAVCVLKAFAAGPNTRDYRFSVRDYRFSPDGRWVAYGIWRKAGPLNKGHGDIYLLAEDGSSESPLIQHPANDELLGWAPFGDRILFASDRRGTWDVYMIQVVDGKPVGEAVFVKAAVSTRASIHVDRRTGLGFTDSGAFYYLSVSDTTDVYVAALDPTTGKIQGNPIKATNVESMNYSPAWSRDSRFLAWTTEHRIASSDGNLRIRDMETGNIRKLATNAGRVDYPRWAPDGRSIFALKGAGMEAVRINRESGISSTIMEGDGKGWWQNHPVWRWSPDGKSFYRQKSIKMLTQRDIETGDEREIPMPVDWAFPVLSPDCEQFVFGDIVPNSEMTVFSRTINICPTNGGAVRKLVEFSELSGAEVRSFLSDSGLGWTPDGRYVLFVKGKSGNSNARSLWRVPAAGGEPEPLGLEMENLRELAISPDDRHIAFTAGGEKTELWSMDNFLPNDDAAAK